MPLSLGVPSLIRSRETLYRLVNYLVHTGHCPSLKAIELRHDKEQDERNALNPRVLCYVSEGEPVINCAKALELVSPGVRTGVLLHEIVHLGLNAMKGDESEVDVDSWILQELPQAGYGYVDGIYHDPADGRQRIARSVQAVSDDFLRELGE